MRNKYNQLNFEERVKLAVYFDQKKHINEIAELLNRHRSTIYREIQRNKSFNYNILEIMYLSYFAQHLTAKRRRETRKIGKLKNEFIRKYVLNKLKQYWSPQQISNKLSIEHPGMKISHESIYKYIYKDHPEYTEYLFRKHKKRRKRITNRMKLEDLRIKNRVFIDKRPKYIEKRKQIGHWESDLMVSRESKACLRVLLERKTRYVNLNKIENKSSKNVYKSITYYFSGEAKGICKSITYDNGIENRLHEKINQSLGTKSYFCNPYHSWEKGSVENMNGLIRRFFKKKTDFNKLTKRKIKRVEKILNNKPRKCLNYNIPLEMFKKEIVALSG